MYKTCVFIILSLLLAACGPGATADPTATEFVPPTRTPRTFDADMVAQTLPASWTPTFTPTVTDTPTVTLTRTGTNTPTITMTPTPLDPTALCDDFVFTYETEDGTVYGPGDLILMSYGLDYLDTAVEFTATNIETGEEVHFVMPGGNIYDFQLDPQQFPGAGTYEWAVSVLGGGKRGLCTHSGTWIIEGVVYEKDTPTPTPRTLLASSPVPSRTPSPEVTAEITAEITDEALIDVTATLSPTPRTIFASSPVPVSTSTVP